LKGLKMGRPRKNPREISGKAKKLIKIPQPQKANSTSFKPGNPTRFPAGVSPNPGGKPRVFRLMSEAYAQLMKEECYLDPYHRTWGEVAAEGMMKASAKGNPAAAKEVRQALEGDRIRTWQDDVIQALKEGKINPEDIIRELGDEIAKPIITAAGIVGAQSGETSNEGKPEEQSA
jgi:hypothetical protein